MSIEMDIRSRLVKELNGFAIVGDAKSNILAIFDDMLHARIKGLEKTVVELSKNTSAAMGIAASLSAAISLLERGGKNAAASDTMFAMMINDYKRALELWRKGNERL